MRRTIPFTKMSGAGNDFVVLEDLPNTNYPALARKICQRTSGIGADGLLVLGKSRRADFRLRIINADGTEAEMCGNGARCMAAYIVRNHKPNKKLFSLETLAGIILAEAKGENARVRLSDPGDYQPDIPLTINGRDILVHFIDTGVPHAIVFVDNLKAIDVNRIGPMIRFNKKFSPRGTNVDFVEQISSHSVAVRTYERGVEAETRACGTGSVASAIVAYFKAHPRIQDTQQACTKVKTASGEILDILFDIKNNQVCEVWLNGSAKFIARGEYYV
ncbi:MAG: diaminopimelate epimerase [Candidatus Omnitrophota bacterium]